MTSPTPWRGRRWFIIGLAAGVLSVGLWSATHSHPVGKKSDHTAEADKVLVRRTERALPRAPIRGRVLASEYNAPVAGAKVTATASDAPLGKAAASVVTDSKGVFELRDLAGVAWDVTAQAPGYAPVTHRVDPALPSSDLVFALERAASVHGTVRIESGEPVAAAKVLIVGSGVWPARETSTAGNGAYEFDGVPGGIYSLRAEAPGLASIPIDGLLLVDGEATVRDVTLETAYALEGAFVDSAAAPVKDARVWVREGAVSMAVRNAASGPDGHFRIEGLRRGRYRMSIQAKGFVAVASMEVGVPTTEPLRIELDRSAVVRGQVVDPEGVAAAGVRLEVVGIDRAGLPVHLLGPIDDALDLDANEAASPLAAAGHLGVTLGGVPPISAADGLTGDAPTGAVYTADARGHFELRGVPPGKFQIVATAPGFAPTASPVTEIATADDLDIGKITLLRGGTIEGHVVDPRGAPASNVYISLTVVGENLARDARTAADGAFRFDGVSGNVTLKAEAPGLPAISRDVVAPSTGTLTVDFVLETEVVTLDGRTTDARGFPVGGASVRVDARSGGGTVSRTTTSNADGTFRLEGLPKPPFTVTTSHEAYATTSTRVDSVERELTFALESGMGLTGRVVDQWTGHALAKVDAILTAGGRTQRTKTNRDGQFTFAKVPAGTLALTLSAPSHAPVVRNLDLQPQRSEDQVDLGDIALEPAAVLAGQVVDRLGNGASNATVAINAPGVSAVRTDADGNFRFPRVPAGSHTLTITHPRAGQATDGPYRVGPGDTFDRITVHLPDRAE